MEEKTCRTCLYFRQHYVRYGRSYREAHCGHCVHLRVKRRTPDDKGCRHYHPRSTQDTPSFEAADKA